MLLFIVILWVLTSWVAAGAFIYLLNQQVQMWKGKFEALEAESKIVYHGHVDATFRRINGQPVFSERTKPQEAVSVFTLAHDRIEDARQAALAGHDEIELTPEDLEVLNS